MLVEGGVTINVRCTTGLSPPTLLVQTAGGRQTLVLWQMWPSGLMVLRDKTGLTSVLTLRKTCRVPLKEQ